MLERLPRALHPVTARDEPVVGAALAALDAAGAGDEAKARLREAATLLENAELAMGAAYRPAVYGLIALWDNDPTAAAALYDEAVRACGHRDAWFVPDRSSLAQVMRDKLRDGDLVLTLGAGDITHLGEELLSLLGTRA